MTEPIDPDFSKLVIAATTAVRAAVADLGTDLGRVARRDVPAFKVNDQGWPSISKGGYGSSTDGPLNWNSLIGVKSATSTARLEPNDVPELQSVIEYVVARKDLRSKVAGLSANADDDVAARLAVHDAVRIVTTVIERADVTSYSELDIYLQLERGLLSPTLKADVIAPLALVKLDIDRPIDLGKGVWIEPLAEATQRARAVDLHGGVNAFMVSAATHAVVLRGRELDNSRGPLFRRIAMDIHPQFVDELDEVFQAIEIASEQRVGYVQIVIRPQDWADGWVGDLPPIESAVTLNRIPVEIAERGWNKPQLTISSSKVEKVPDIYSALVDTHPRARLAARRLFQSALRAMDEDIVLDACIGIEALLGEEHDELVHRMGLRASAALASQGVKSDFAYQALKKVYGHRSKIIHGTEPKNSKIDMGGGATYSVRSVAVWLLRLLLQSHLGVSPGWTPQSLDRALHDAVDNHLGHEETEEEQQ